MNPCGECEACCVLFRIPELDKPAYQACTYLRNGCRIHDNAPPSCKRFDCCWRQSPTLLVAPWWRLIERPHYRPDKCGLVITFPDIYLAKVYVWETRADASKEYWAKRLISLLAAHYTVILRKYSEQGKTLYLLNCPAGRKS